MSHLSAERPADAGTERGYCEPCGKYIERGQFIHVYDDVGEVHVNCDNPWASTDPAAIDPEAGPVYVLLGSPALLCRAALATPKPGQSGQGGQQCQ